MEEEQNKMKVNTFRENKYAQTKYMNTCIEYINQRTHKIEGKYK